MSMTVRQQLISTLRGINRDLQSEYQQASVLQTRRGWRFIESAIEAMLRGLEWEFGGKVEVETIKLSYADSNSLSRESMELELFSGGTRVDLLISSAPCKIILSQDLSARLLHQAMLGVAIPRFTTELKIAAVAFSVVELLVRQEQLQRVPVSLRAVDLLTSREKLADSQHPSTNERMSISVTCGFSVGVHSYAMQILPSLALVQWVTSYIRQLPIHKSQLFTFAITEESLR